MSSPSSSPAPGPRRPRRFPPFPLLLAALAAILLALRFPLTRDANNTASPAASDRSAAAVTSAAASAPAPLPPPGAEPPAFAPPSAARPASSAVNLARTRAPDVWAATAALLDWNERQLAATAAAPADLAALLDEGLALARARRPLLAELIRRDPEAALAAAISRTRRAQLPAEIVAELEVLVSARANLSLNQSCFHPPGTPRDHRHELTRSTVIDDREYRVHTYGARLLDATLPATSLLGIAIDRDLAVSDARYRLLAPDEPLPADLPVRAASSTSTSSTTTTAATSAEPSPLAVEADGVITLLPSPADLPAFAASLLASEQNPLAPSAILEADAGQGSSTVSGRPSQAWTHGAKRLLVIRVDFSDLPGTPKNFFDGNADITPAYIDAVINGTQGVRDFLAAASYGKTDVTFNSATDVTGVLRLPQTASYYATNELNDELHQHARALATAAGFNVAAYDRVAVVFSRLSALPGSQITYGGLANITGSSLWINSSFDLRVVAHELGHNYGLRHANLWQVADANPVSLAGSSFEYGDPFDLMGDGDFFENDFSHWNKSLLQWIPDTAVTTITAAGTYRVSRFDASAANLAAPRALKIVRDSTRDYWIGYRRGTASSAADNGAYVLWGYNVSTEGDLLDLTTPGAGATDAPLALNTTFNDSAAGITLRPVAQGGSGADEWLDVQVTFQSRIQWAATSYVVNEQGGSAVLTVTRSNNPTGIVTVNYATAPGTATAPADYTHTTGTLTWLDGDTAAKTVTVPLVADALVEGTEAFTVTLSSPSGGVVVDADATATVTLADPGARDPAFAPDFINSTVNRTLVDPEGRILVAGWFSLVQDAAFDVYSFGRIARLRTDGALDTSFNPGTGADGTIHALALQPDGKILIGGGFATVNGTARGRLARLNTDGSLDTTFAIGAAANNSVLALVVQPDGKILVGGDFTTYDGTAREYLARLNADGTLDTSFTGPDFGATSGWRVESLALQPDGKILVGGAFYFSGGASFRAGLCRVSSDGSLDAAFNGVTNGAHASGNTGNLRSVREIVVQPDGTLLIAGTFTAFNNTARGGLARLTSTGAIDASYNPAPNAAVSALLRLPDGRLLIGGDFTAVGAVSAARIALISAAGAPDAAFAAAGGHGNSVEDLVLQPDGNVVLVGDFDFFQDSAYDGPVWRFVPGLPALPGVLQFSADTFAGAEGSTATLGVTRTGGGAGALTLGYATVAGSATAGSDYTPTTGTLTWADGDTATKTITVPLTADASAESAETFLVNLGAPQVGTVLLGARQQATVTVATAFATWQAANFTTLELANAAVSGDTADPDGDGFNNLTEFALGMDPRVASPTGAPVTAVQNIGGTNYLTITFRRRTPALDLAYTVQTSGDLTGAWGATAVQVGLAAGNGDGTETVTFRDSVAAGSANPRRFLRVQVTRTP